MTQFRIAAQTRTLAPSVKQGLLIARRLECAGVQFDARRELPPADLSDTGLRQLRKILDDLNLRVGSVVFPTRHGYSTTHDLERRLEATHAALELASRLRSRFLICNLGPVSTEADSPLQTTLTEALLSLAGPANRFGVQLVAQAPADDAATLVTLIESLPAGTLLLDLHPAQLLAHGHSPAEFLAAAGRYVGHVHAADAVYDLASRQAAEVELGRGTVDFPELLALLEEHAYRDWVTIERTQSQNPIDDVGNAVKYLRSL